MTDQPPTVADVLRVHGELHSDEWDALLEHWTKLDHRLQSFERRAVALDLYIRDRDMPSQHVTLEANISGFPTLVATDDTRDLGASLNHVRDELVRQITDAKNKTEPRNNRHLRDTTRH